MTKCKRCGHEIPERCKYYSIIYEKVHSDNTMVQVPMCRFCQEAFERFLRNEPTVSVYKNKPKRNKEKKEVTYGEPIQVQKSDYFVTYMNTERSAKILNKGEQHEISICK